jgi:hypothetical protein
MSLCVSALAGLGRRTVADLLVVSGQAFRDWTAAYRLFQKRRVDPQAFFDVVKESVEERLAPDQPFVTPLDDTLVRKAGKKVPGTGWRRDPLGPKFKTQFAWAQRFLQIAVAWPFDSGTGEAGVIPIDFVHAPTPPKLKKNASEEERKRRERERKLTAVTRVAVERLGLLRAWLDRRPGGKTRPLHAVGDGGFTNETVLKGLPARTVFIGRVRKDAKLHFVPTPEDQNPHGRKRTYGRRAPTPEALLRDPGVPFQEVNAFAAGQEHAFRVKTLSPVLSDLNGGRQALRLLVIAPLGYRPKKGSRVLYREAAPLICTDPEWPVEKVVQEFAWRWGIEVNHRDEKTLLGVGEAQVRHPEAAARVPALLVATYALLRVAARLAFGTAPLPETLPRPKWQRETRRTHASTVELLRHLRAELWGRVLGLAHFSRFATRAPADANGEKYPKPRLDAAALYASR